MIAAMKRLRRTGRTTRLVAQATTLAREGRAVYVVVATKRDITRLLTMLQTAGYSDNGAIKVETWESLFGLDTGADMHIAGAHPNCAVLVDHFAIESRFGALLEELHRFDEVKS